MGTNLIKISIRYCASAFSYISIRAYSRAWFHVGEICFNMLDETKDVSDFHKEQGEKEVYCHKKLEVESCKASLAKV